jgi:hypothetical protein
VTKAFGRDRPIIRTLGRSLPSSPPLHLVALARKWIRVNPESTKTLSCAWLPRSLGVWPAIQPRDK